MKSTATIVKEFCAQADGGPWREEVLAEFLRDVLGRYKTREARKLIRELAELFLTPELPEPTEEW